MRIYIPKIIFFCYVAVPLYEVVYRVGMGGNEFRVFEPKEQRGGDIHARSNRGGIPRRPAKSE